MTMRYCKLCGAYTPEYAGSCSVCGLGYVGGDTLGVHTKEARRYMDSVLDPIMVRPNRDRVIELHDTRFRPDPFYVKVTYPDGREEYMIMDYDTLADGIGFPPSAGKDGIGRDSARFGTSRIDSVAYTTDEDRIVDLNRRSGRWRR